MTSAKRTVRKSLFLYTGLLVGCLSLTGICLWGNLGRQPGCAYSRVWFRDKCEYERTFTADVLLIDGTFLPEEVEVIPSEGIGNHRAMESAAIDFYSTGDVLVGWHEIERWASSTRAEDSFVHTNDTDGLVLAPCGIRHNVDYWSPVADQFCAACTVGDHCTAVGQYQDYVSIFKLDIGAAGLTQADFIAGLVQIDERMAQYLELEDDEGADS